MQKRYRRGAGFLCAQTASVVQIRLDFAVLVAYVPTVLAVVHIPAYPKALVDEGSLHLPVAAQLFVAQLGVEGVCAEQPVDLFVTLCNTLFELKEVLFGKHPLDDVD